MRLVQILKKLFSSGQSLDQLDDVAFIHEDDVRQIELIPFENLDFFLKKSKKITSSSEKNFDGYGWSTVTVRSKHPVELISRNIPTIDFEILFTEQGFDKKELRFLGFPKMRINHFVLIKNTINIYYEIESKNLASIYFNFHINNKDVFEFNKILLQMSNDHGLLLADWNLLDFFDTRNEEEILRFNNRYNETDF